MIREIPRRELPDATILVSWNAKDIVRRLIHLRKDNLEFVYGDYRTLEVSDNIFVYMRSYFDKVAFVIFNRDRSPVKIDFEMPERFNNVELKSNFGNNFKIEKNKISLTLKPNSFEIITNN